MEIILDPKFKYAWALVLAIALYLASRALLYGIFWRRARRRHGELSPESIKALRVRATLAGLLLSFALAFFYTHLVG